MNSFSCILEQVNVQQKEILEIIPRKEQFRGILEAFLNIKTLGKLLIISLNKNINTMI